MIISIVVAASDNNVIGKNGSLPWKMPADMKFFKQLTLGHVVIMGRKTYQSMGKPLPERKNVVVTRQKNFQAEGCVIFSSLEKPFNAFADEKEVFVIGGAEIYKQALPYAHKIYLTRIHAHINGDTFFPDITPKEWIEAENTHKPVDKKNPFPYSFIRLERKS